MNTVLPGRSTGGDTTRKFVVTTWVYRIALSIGGSLLLVSTVLYVVFGRAVRTEQALSPGKKSFGLGVLAMAYSAAIYATAALGLLSLLVGWAVLTVQRLRN